MPSTNSTPRSSAAPRQFEKDLIAHMSHLRAFGHKLCHNREMAEDMAQETLTKAWRARDRFEPGTNLRAWLFTILRNEVYSQRRRAWRQTHWDEVKGNRLAAAPDPQLWSLAISDTANALRQLPNQQREALILVGAGGFSYEETGKICGTKVGTVKSRVARGREALFQILNGHEAVPCTSAVREVGGAADILAQLSTLSAAGTRSAAYA